MALVLGNYVNPKPVNMQASTPGFGTIAGASQAPSLGPGIYGSSFNSTYQPNSLFNPQTQLAGSVKIGGGSSGGTGLAAAPYKPPGATKTPGVTGGYQLQLPQSGPSSNTAGGGGTLSDVNSGNANYTPGSSAYAPSDLGQINSNWFQQQLDNDEQYKADLAAIAAKGGNYLDAFTAAAQAAEIAAGFPFNPDTAAQAGYRFPSVTDPVTGNPISMGPLFSALSDPTTVQAAQSNPFSTNAQILHAYNQLLNQQDAHMAAGGQSGGDFYNASGDYSGGYQHQDAAYQRNLANYNAINNLLGQINTGYTNYQGQLDQLHADTLTARQNDLNKILSMINAGLLSPPSQTNQKQPPYDPSNPPTGTEAGLYPGFKPPPTNTPYYYGSGVGTYTDANSTGTGYAPPIANYNDGEYDAWVWANDPNNPANQTQYTPVPIADTGTALAQAQQAAYGNNPNVRGLSPDIGNWRT